jgi:hypothetical protein
MGQRLCTAARTVDFCMVPFFHGFMRADLRISIKEFRDGFDGVTGWDDFGFAGVEFVGGVRGAGEGAVGFAIEAGREGGEGGGEKIVEFDVEVEDGEAGFEGGEGGEHGVMSKT